MRTALCHISGGIDSAAAAIRMIECGWRVEGHVVLYGQRYQTYERNAAAYVAKTLGISLHVQHANLRTQSPDDETNQYVPNRNAVLVMLSGNLAISRGIQVIAVGSKTDKRREDDPYCFPDTTSEFYAACQRVLEIVADKGSSIDIKQPVAGWTKRQAVEIVQRSGLDPRQLRSCYGDTSQPCGECHNCLEWKELGLL